MKWIITILLLTVISSAEAALSEKFKQTDAQFSARVKPHLLSLDNDFFDIFLSFRPELSPVKEISRNNVKILKELQYMHRICRPNVFVRCQASLKILEEFVRQNHALTYTLKRSGPCAMVTKSKCTFSISILNDLYLATQRAQNNLKLGLTSPRPAIFWSVIEKDLGDIRTFTQGFISQNFPDSLNQDFQVLWNGFFKVNQDLFLSSSNAKLFQAWVDRLNFSINEFLLSLSNKEKLLPQGLKLKAEVMHTKWNLMLKEYL